MFIIQCGVESLAQPSPAWFAVRAKLLELLALKPLVAAEHVDRAGSFGGSHEPGARIIRDARFRPLLE